MINLPSLQVSSGWHILISSRHELLTLAWATSDVSLWEYLFLYPSLFLSIFIHIAYLGFKDLDESLQSDDDCDDHWAYMTAISP